MDDEIECKRSIIVLIDSEQYLTIWSIAETCSRPLLAAALQAAAGCCCSAHGPRAQGTGSPILEPTVPIVPLKALPLHTY